MLYYCKDLQKRYSDCKSDISANQVLVTNIAWNSNCKNSKIGNKSTELPSQVIVNIPQNILAITDELSKDDELESFVYSYIAKQFNHEIYNCQIWKWCQIQDEFAVDSDFVLSDKNQLESALN